MTVQELGKRLSEMYENADDGEKATMVHLFGIRFANDITNNNFSASEIILAKYVCEKEKKCTHK